MSKLVGYCELPRPPLFSSTVLGLRLAPKRYGVGLAYYYYRLFFPLSSGWTFDLTAALVLLTAKGEALRLGDLLACTSRPLSAHVISTRRDADPLPETGRRKHTEPERTETLQLNRRWRLVEREVGYASPSCRSARPCLLFGAMRAVKQKSKQTSMDKDPPPFSFLALTQKRTGKEKQRPSRRPSGRVVGRDQPQVAELGSSPSGGTGHTNAALTRSK
jgi:hypothetical protein